MNELVPQSNPLQSLSPRDRMLACLKAWLGAKTPQTLRGYQTSLESFAQFVGVKSVSDAVGTFFSLTHGDANITALNWRNWMKNNGSSSNTINTRLAALRSLVDAANAMDVVPWTIQIRCEKIQIMRDVKGPDKEGVEKIFEATDRPTWYKWMAFRDKAMLWLLYGLALRREEVCSLDTEHVDYENHCIWVKRKGIDDRVRFTLSTDAEEAMRTYRKTVVEGGWIKEDAFFINPSGKRLSASGLWRIIKRLGKIAGLDVHPHSLRHAAITESLNLTNGNIREVQRFAGHSDPKTTMGYDDSRVDYQGQIAQKLADSRKKKEESK